MSEAVLRRILPKTLWGDRLFGLYRFRKRLGRFPERRPTGFNDHLFALKTGGLGYDPLIQLVTDKEHAKLYISSVLGSEYTIETYRVLRGPEELETFVPDRFPCVVKPTHSSGQAAICTDPSGVPDRDELRRWFEIRYYRRSREHNYRHLIPKIIVEEFFSEDGHTVPDDYKVFCVRGVPKFVQVDSDRFTGHTRNLYDLSWARIPATLLYPGRDSDDPRPALLDDMLRAARRLSAPFPFVRVDLYATEREMRVGELTFVPGSAGEPLNPPEAEFALGAHFRDEDER
ncbi:MAG: ATP-grasp fold amidoligase family protein [Defluviicoccus sp.]|nr:ATP-grasp fold amidoligase family protein [Defluviicoccus sp.]MDE0386777.1 ATP-grasp fold amidoligase family protein [Defluviicoccus sp.]